MKILKSFFLIALMALSFSLHADNEKPEARFNVQTEVVDQSNIIYTVYNLQQMITTVRITSIDGENTFYKNVIKKHNGYSEMMRMGQLTDGRYLFEITQGETTKKQVILIRNKQVALSAMSN